jgi:hypothetical protein
MQKPLITNKLAVFPHLKRTFFSTGWLLASLLLLLTGITTTAQAAGFGNNYVTIGGTNTAINGYYYTNSNTLTTTNSTAKSFVTIGNLGAYDRGTSSLLLGGEANTTQEQGNNAATSVTLFYRVYPVGANSSDIPNFTQLALAKTGSSGNGANAVSNWKTATSIELLTSTSGPGNYTLELFYQLISSRTPTQPLFDTRPNGANYTASFSVSGSQPVTWNGSRGDGNWFNPLNWTPSTVPTATTDATIPYIAGARNQSYPSISTGGIAQVRTLRILGSGAGIGARNFLTAGELRIFGDFQDTNGGFSQTGGIFTLAGTNQSFDGASFFDVRIQGGGFKNLTSRMDVSSTLTFINGGGILATRTDNTLLYSVDLGVAARVIGESENSYVLGILRTPFRYVIKGVTATFGDIGSAPDPGSTLVVRTTGVTYTGVGVKDASVKRSFAFTPDNPNDLNFTLVFRFLNNETNALDVSKLSFARSVTGAGPFEDLGRSSNSSNSATSNPIAGTLAATFTLGETDKPLPVTLVSFTAAPTTQGAALLRWVTATETNNKGFGIERQLANGDTWQSVGYLASGNNAKGGTYEYTDKSLISAVSTPQAYYRLRQEDQDGTLSYSPVAVVARQAVLASTNLQLSPVPVTGANLSLTFAEAGQAGSEISIINTQGQRLYSYTTQASSDAALSLPVERLAAGVYIVSVRVAGQAVRHARFVKL